MRVLFGYVRAWLIKLLTLYGVQFVVDLEFLFLMNFKEINMLNKLLMDNFQMYN